MIIKDLKKHISKNYPGLNIPREIGLYEKYGNLIKIEETIKTTIKDFVHPCCFEDWDRVFRIEVFLGPEYVNETTSRKKERAIKYLIADSYLKELLKKKVITKYSIESRPYGRYTQSYSVIKARISLKPQDVMGFN